MQSFAAWLRQNAALLDAGHELLVPILLAHPGAIGFADSGAALGHAHARVWTLAMREGRLVVDEYGNGQCIVRMERSQTASVARGVTAAVDAVVDVAETGVALIARGLVEIGARLER
jgi:hypothetical protein